MQTRSACIIRNKINQKFIGRHYDTIIRDMEHTANLFSAMRFADEANASEWLLNSMYAPKNTQDYDYVTVEMSIEVKEVETHVQQKRIHQEYSGSISQV